MGRRTRLIVSGLCAVLSLALCLAYGEHVREESERVRTEALERYGGEVVTLVVATEEIPAGESVTRANAAEREWIVDLAPAGAVTNFDEVVGSEVSVPVSAGAPLTELNFRAATEVVDVPADRVALTLPTSSDLGVPPGTVVGDTLAAYKADEDGVRLISADLRVLATPQTGSGVLSPGSLTVAVAPGDVAKLLSASDEGSLRLALPGDQAFELSGEVQQAPTSVPAETDDEGDEDDVDDVDGADGVDDAGASDGDEAAGGAGEGPADEEAQEGGDAS